MPVKHLYLLMFCEANFFLKEQKYELHKRPVNLHLLCIFVLSWSVFSHP